MMILQSHRKLSMLTWCSPNALSYVLLRTCVQYFSAIPIFLPFNSQNSLVSTLFSHANQDYSACYVKRKRSFALPQNSYLGSSHAHTTYTCAYTCICTSVSWTSNCLSTTRPTKNINSTHRSHSISILQLRSKKLLPESRSKPSLES